MTLLVDSEMPSNVGSGIASPGSPYTFVFNNVGGGLVLLFIMFGCGSGDTVTINSAPTFGGTPMTLVATKTTSAGGVTGGKIALYSLLSAPTGNQTVSIDYGVAPGAIAELEAGCISFTGHDTTTPVKQSATAATGGSNSTPATASLSGVVAGNISVFGAGAGSDMTAQTKTLSWVKNVDGASAMGNGRVSRSAASGTVTESFTISASDSWATIAVEIAAAGGTPATQIVAPTADVSAGAWLAEPGDGTTNLWDQINETVLSATDYVQSSQSPVAADIYKFRIAPLQAPVKPRTDGSFHFRVDALKDVTGGDNMQLTVKLYAADGTTLIKAWTPIAVDVEATTDLTLTGAEADTIPDADFAVGLVLAFEALKV